MRYELKYGCNPNQKPAAISIDGELPIGGLSSSAAVIITFLSALCHLNAVTLTPSELIEISKEAENRYVGVSCGKLDQSCEVYCRKEQLLYMDLKDDSWVNITAKIEIEYNNDYDEEEIVLYPIKLEVIEPIKNQILDLR